MAMGKFGGGDSIKVYPRAYIAKMQQHLNTFQILIQLDCKLYF